MPTPPGPTMRDQSRSASSRCSAATSARPADQPGRPARGAVLGPAPVSARTGCAAGDVALQLAKRRRRVEAGLLGQPVPVLPRPAAAPPGARPWPPAPASAAAPRVPAAGRRRATRPRGRGPRRLGRPSIALAISASVTSRCSRSYPSTAASRSARTSVRSASIGPRQSACACRSRANAAAGSALGRGRAAASSARARAHVQVVGAEVEPVAVVPGLQPGGGAAEMRAQPKHVGVQGLSPRLRRLRRPQRVDQLVDGDGPALGERQQRKHRTPFRARGRRPPRRRRPAAAARAPRPGPVAGRPRRHSAPPAPMPASVQQRDRRSCCQRRMSARVSARVSAASEPCSHDRHGPARTRRESHMDHDKVMEFLGRFTTDLGATGSAGLGGDRQPARPLPRAGQGPATPEQFAARTGYHERYLTEWLRGQAAGGYVSYDPATGEFSLTAGAGVLPGRPERPERARRRSSAALGLPARRTAAHRGIPHRRGRRLARAPRGRLRRAATRSTGPATSPSWCRAGSRRWTGSRRS